MIHSQNQVPQRIIDIIASSIRVLQLDGKDLHDIAVSVDLDEPNYIGAGRSLWSCLTILAILHEVSASYLIDEACVVLGWSAVS